jgi:protein-tyrosine phosphatase
MIDKPIPQSYWVLPGQFLAGEYPALGHDAAGTRKRLIAFLNAGVDTFIDLTRENERPRYESILLKEAKNHGRQVHHQRFSFPDFSIPTRPAMVAALDAVDTALTDGRTVYLHCVGGIGRTGLVVGCYLIRHGMEPAQALQNLRGLFSASLQSLFVRQTPETDEQVRFILDWKENGLA